MRLKGSIDGVQESRPSPTIAADWRPHSAEWLWSQRDPVSPTKSYFTIANVPQAARRLRGLDWEIVVVGEADCATEAVSDCGRCACGSVLSTLVFA